MSTEIPEYIQRAPEEVPFSGRSNRDNLQPLELDNGGHNNNRRRGKESSHPSNSNSHHSSLRYDARSAAAGAGASQPLTHRQLKYGSFATTTSPANSMRHIPGSRSTSRSVNSARPHLQGVMPASPKTNVHVIHRSASNHATDNFSADHRRGPEKFVLPNPLAEEASLPSPLQVVYQFLFLDLREAGDDFDTVLKKIVVSFGMPLVVFPIAFAIYMASEVARSGVSAGAVTTLVIMFVFPLLWIPSFIFVRVTKETPPWLMDTWLIVTTVACGVLALCLIEYPIAILAFFLAALAILCHTPRLWFELALSAVVYGIAALNSAFLTGTTPEVTLLALPVPYRGSLLERVAYQTTGFVIGLIIIAALMMQMREHVRQIESARDAADMSREVAQQLQRYDTEAVQHTLEAYHKLGRADPELLETFAAIVDNLEWFRPHLPNWMLMAAAGEGEGEDVELLADQTSDARSVSVESMRSMKLDQQARSRPTHLERPASAQSDLISVRTGSGFSLRDQLMDGRDKLPGAKKERSFAKKPAMDPSMAMGPKPIRSKITYTILEITANDDLGGRKFESIGSKFVDRVHQVASETHAALHTFVGDALHASWNTATRVALSEVKAARFVASLQKDRGDPAIDVHGCVMTGEARSHLAGTKQTALTISFKWRDALHAAVLHSRKYKACFLDGETHKAAKPEIVSRGVDAIRVRNFRFDIEELVDDFASQDSQQGSPQASVSLSPLVMKKKPNRTRIVEMYQLFREREERDLSHDDWMYTPQPDQVRHENALGKCLQGDYAGAIDDINHTLRAMRTTRTRSLENTYNQFSSATLEEATWVDEDEEDVDLEDPIVRALLGLRTKAESAMKRNIAAEAFPEDMSIYF
jgi:hypothetical protein